MDEKERDGWERLKEIERLDSLLTEKIRNPFSNASKSEIRSIENRIKELVDKK